MRLPERLPLLVCTVPLLLYAATLSANFNFDGIVFALLLRQSLAVGSPFSHLHFQHLLYGPSTFLFARPLPVDPLRALQLFGWGVTELSLLLFLLPSLLPRFLPTWPPIAPRFAYLASPLAALFFTELALWAFKRGLRIPAFLLLLFLIFSWGTLLRLHLPFFRDDDTYIRTMSLRYPDEESFLFQLSFKEAQRGDLRKALLLVDKGLALSPSSPWVDYSRKGRTLRANILILLGREAEGEQEVERLLRATPSPEEGYSLHLLRAILLERKGDGEGALEELTLAGRLGKTPELLLRTARLQKRVGRGEESLRSLEEALNLGLDPKIAERERVEIQNRRESERE